MLIGEADIENGSPFFGRPVRATLGFFLRPWSGVGGPTPRPRSPPFGTRSGRGV